LIIWLLLAEVVAVDRLLAVAVAAVTELAQELRAVVQALKAFLSL
jgi:hypothetical protein